MNLKLEDLEEQLQNKKQKKKGRDQSGIKNETRGESGATRQAQTNLNSAGLSTQAMDNRKGFDSDGEEVVRAVETPSVAGSVTETISGDEPPKEYEKMLQKLEGDVRMHIRIEQQLKLHIDNIEFRLDEAEKENNKLAKKHDISLAEIDKM